MNTYYLTMVLAKICVSISLVVGGVYIGYHYADKMGVIIASVEGLLGTSWYLMAILALAGALSILVCVGGGGSAI